MRTLPQTPSLDGWLVRAAFTGQQSAQTVRRISLEWFVALHGAILGLDKLSNHASVVGDALSHGKLDHGDDQYQLRKALHLLSVS